MVFINREGETGLLVREVARQSSRFNSFIHGFVSITAEQVA